MWVLAQDHFCGIGDVPALYDRDPVEIDVATGSYDVPGWNPGFGIVVHKDNPLSQLTMRQLDGIFGASARVDGKAPAGVHKMPADRKRTFARGANWGSPANGDKPINVYGLNLRYHQATEMSDTLLKGSDKWNEHLRIYANYVSAAGKLERGLNEDLAKDRYGIAYIAAPTTNLGAKAHSRD